MPRPRISLRSILTAIVATALNLGAMRQLYGSSRPWALLVFGVMPAATIVALAAAAVVLDLRKRGEARPFLVGFASFGAAACVVAAALYADGDRALSVAESLLRPLEPWLAPLSSHVAQFLGDAILVAALASPQVSAGVLGGWLARRLGVTLILRSGPRTVLPPAA